MRLKLFCIVLTMLGCLAAPVQAAEPAVAAPIVAPKAGIYEGPINVRFASETPHVAIYYTLDGSTPTTSSRLYGLRPGQPIPIGGPPDIDAVILGVWVSSSTVLKAIAVVDGVASKVAEYRFEIRVERPEASPRSGAFRKLPAEVRLSKARSGARIIYTTDGSTPSRDHGAVYAQPLQLSGGTTIKAVAVEDGMPDSTVASFSYSLDPSLVMLTDPGATPQKITSEMTKAEKCRMVSGAGTTPMGAAGATYSIERLGIPSASLNDGPSGISFWNGPTKRYASAWPNASLLASAWDADLMNRLGKALAVEGLYYGADILLAPAINIQRDPLGGRNWEYYSEDPFLAGTLATAFTDGAQSGGLGVDLKHFAANNSENNRGGGNEVIAERTLREIYLPAFEMAVKKAQPWTIMAALNKVNGSYNSENTHLQTDILKNEWGFQGYIMSDWGAYHSPVAIKAGLDLNTPGGERNLNEGVNYADDICNAVADGVITETDLDGAIYRQLAVLIKTNTFRKVQKGITDGLYTSVEDFAKSLVNKTSLPADIKASSARLAKEAASEGIVMLKNNGVLPLKRGLRIGTAGSNWYDVAVDTVNYKKGFIYGGKAASAVILPEDIVSPAEGLKSAGFALTETDKAGKPFRDDATDADAAAMAVQADVAIISIGLIGQEGADNASFSLGNDQVQMIRRFARAFHRAGKKAIVLLNTSAPVEAASWESDVDAVLWTGLPGEQGGAAIADILTGKTNPSGKLTTTWPVRYQDVPDYGFFPSNRRDTFAYSEGIYVGYRYYDTRGIKPLYHFGYGLSYTRFKYSNLSFSRTTFDLSNAGETITVSADVKNIGRVPGREVAQLYIHDDTASVDRPTKELKGFAKTRLLKPGETERVSFVIGRRALSFFKPDSLTEGGWTAEPGDFTVYVGGTSDPEAFKSGGTGLSAVLTSK